MNEDKKTRSPGEEVSEGELKEKRYDKEKYCILTTLPYLQYPQK